MSAIAAPVMLTGAAYPAQSTLGAGATDETAKNMEVTGRSKTFVAAETESALKSEASISAENAVVEPDCNKDKASSVSDSEHSYPLHVISFPGGPLLNPFHNGLFLDGQSPAGVDGAPYVSGLESYGLSNYRAPSRELHGDLVRYYGGSQALASPFPTPAYNPQVQGTYYS